MRGLTEFALRGTALAQTQGVIYACVNNKTGSLYLVSQNAPCKTGETKMQWNVTGPTGATAGRLN